VVTCLQGGWETFLGTLGLAGTLEEGVGFVLVFPNRLLEVLSCGGVVSAHLGEGGHDASFDRLEPLGGSESQEGGCLPVSGKGKEAALGSEDLLVLVFKVIQEFVPFFECLCFHFGEGCQVGNK